MWKDILKFGNEGFATIDEDSIKEFRWIGELNKRKIGIAGLTSGERILVYISAHGTSGKKKGAFYRLRNMTMNHPKYGEGTLWFAKYREDFDTKELKELDELYAEGKLPKYVRSFPTHREVNSEARFDGVVLGNTEYPQFYDRRRDG